MQLLIENFREEIVATVRKYPVTVVVGETGSGKSTRLARFFYSASAAGGGMIGVTEPRRIAAISLARFVSDELCAELGGEVGYQIRFNDLTSPQTKIKYMTDGILLQEIRRDPNLSRYSVIVVDEAHERSVNIDFTLGLLKDLLKRRSDLKVIVSSATIDTEKFSRYFGGAPVIEIIGRSFPVEIIWGRCNHFSRTTLFEEMVQTVSDIHHSRPAGDILVFLPGADDINAFLSELEKLGEGLRDTVLLPAHGGLSPEDQQKIFRDFPGKRKIIAATNIAETSITVDGVVYIVDSGLIKQTSFHPDSGIQSLDVVKHSQAGCEQRAGRAGRTRPGMCYRMFTEEDFRERPKHTEPEIRRTGLAGVVLSMELIGIAGVEEFDFLDPPEAEAFRDAYETLIALGAVAHGGGLTALGREMANLPLEPRIARMALEAEKYGCIVEVATIAAFLSARSVFVRPKGKEMEADLAHRQFMVGRSDVLTYLRIWNAYEQTEYDRNWCFENFLNSRSLWEIKNIRSQLLQILRRRGEATSNPDEEVVLRSVASGLARNLLEHRSRHAYDDGQDGHLSAVFIHPGSAVFGGFRDPRFVVCAEIIKTSKTFARGVSVVEPEWLPELAPNKFSFGQIFLKRFGEDGGIIAVRDVIRKDTRERIGTKQIVLNVKEAREVQDASVRLARDNGWVPLVFREEEDQYGFCRLTARNGREVYELAAHGLHPEENVEYYCEIRENLIFGGLKANPRFVVLDLDGTVEASDDAKAETEFSAARAAEMLKSAWGIR